jgi:hypothetical protein
MMRTTRHLAYGALALCLSGCDGGETPDTDAGMMLPPLEAKTEDESAMAFVPATLDYACLGSRTAPTSGAPIDATFHLLDFQFEEGPPDNLVLDNAEVWVFNSNVIGDNCDGSDCQRIVTDGAAQAQVSLPTGGWYAYRVIPHDDLISDRDSRFEVFQYNELAPTTAGAEVEGTSVNGVTINTIPALLGIARTDGLAIIAGRIFDCNENFVQNAIVRLYDPDGNEILSNTAPDRPNDDPLFAYFNGDQANNLPNVNRVSSNSDGLYVMVQIPYLDARPYRIEAWGNVDGEMTRLACETARIFEDAVTILNMTPLRSDAPAECD